MRLIAPAPRFQHLMSADASRPTAGLASLPMGLLASPTVPNGLVTGRERSSTGVRRRWKGDRPSSVRRLSGAGLSWSCRRGVEGRATVVPRSFQVTPVSAQSWRDQTIAFLSEHWLPEDMDHNVAVSELHAVLVQLFRGARLRKRMEQEDLIKFLIDGELKTLFDLAKDVPRYESWPAEKRDRAFLESSMFSGYSCDETICEPRPRYGYVTSDEIELDNDSLNNWGDVVIEFDSGQIDSFTITLSDSGGVTRMASISNLAPTVLSQLHWTSSTRPNPDFSGLLGYDDVVALRRLSDLEDYAEAQIHVAPTPTDVALCYLLRDPLPDLVSFAASNAVPFPVVGPDREMVDWNLLKDRVDAADAYPPNEG